MQRIHKYSIDSQRKAIKPVSIEVFTEFIFNRHNLQSLQREEGKDLQTDGYAQLQQCLGFLDGITAPAISWEGDILPSRIINYEPNFLIISASVAELYGGAILCASKIFGDIKVIYLAHLEICL